LVRQRAVARPDRTLAPQWDTPVSGEVTIGATTAFEPFESIAAEAVRRGTNTLTGFVEDIDLEPGTFDLVCGWHVLEHIPDPMPALSRLHRIVRPGGVAAFELPNFACVLSRHRGQRWAYLEPRHHVNQFTPTSIRRLFVGAGFRVQLVTMVLTRAA